VDAPQGLSSGQPLQGLEPERVLAQREGSLVPEIAVAQPLEGAFSRPARVLARLSGPVGRSAQRCITSRYLGSIESLVRRVT
jgi:uncharacterized protein (UPF0548 family)